jgi:hypothetical protein
MQSQSPAPSYAPPPQKNDPYDFLMTSGTPTKRGFGAGGFSSSQKTRIIIAAIVATFIFIIGALVFGLILSKGDETTTNLVTIAEQQTELTRLSAEGVKKSRSTDTKNLAITIQLSVESDKAAILAALKAQKQKIDPKQLSGKRDPKTDKLLEQAERNNNFDAVLVSTLRSQLKEYQTTLRQTYDLAPTQKTKSALDSSFKNAATLLATIDPQSAN